MNYPFHTAEIEGKESCALIFSTERRKIFEFLDPAEHDKYAKYQCPATGSHVVHDTVVNHAIATSSAGVIHAIVPATEWQKLRHTYVKEVDNGDTVTPEKMERWIDMLEM